MLSALNCFLCFVSHLCWGRVCYFHLKIMLTRWGGYLLWLFEFHEDNGKWWQVIRWVARCARCVPAIFDFKQLGHDKETMAETDRHVHSELGTTHLHIVLRFQILVPKPWQKKEKGDASQSIIKLEWIQLLSMIPMIWIDTFYTYMHAYIHSWWVPDFPPSSTVVSPQLQRILGQPIFRQPQYVGDQWVYLQQIKQNVM